MVKYMIIKYNIAKIRSFLYDFHKITGLTISAWDSDFNQLAFQPTDMPEFCKLIKSTNLGNKRCLLSDKIICSNCKKRLEAVTHKCHAGLVDTAIPITFNGRILGFIMFGQVIDKQLGRNTYEEIKNLSLELKLPIEQLYNAYISLKTFDLDTVKSAANILKAAICYLYLSDGIKFTDNELVTAIDTYITNNIHNPISVSNLCDEFRISKCKLYSLWKQWFGLTIGDYILEKRMEIAKNMLTNSDSKIIQISNNVGIPDYNYFTKVFKKYYGIPPREYRKKFPIILENNKI